jgi:hypothetical protein
LLDRRRIEVTAELRERGQLAVLRQLQAQRSGDFFHGLRLRGAADAADADADVDRGPHALVVQVRLQEDLAVGNRDDVGRDVGGQIARLRLDLAQYRELAAFAQFGSDLDKSTQAQLTRGARLVEILKQSQYAPLPVERQVAIIFAGTNGYLDAIAVSDLRLFESELFSYLESRVPEVLRGIAEKKQIDDELKATMSGAIKTFATEFAARKAAAA